MKRPFLMAGFPGIAVIIVSLAIGSFFPRTAGKLPDGFKTPILAFEFLQTKQEAYDLFGAADSPERQALAKAMDRGNTWDYLYMLVYSSFLAALALKIQKRTGNKFYYFAAALVVAILAGDFLENRQLFRITGGLAAGDFDPALPALYMFTWLKWGTIALFFLILAPYFVRGGIFSKIVAAGGVVNFIVTGAAFLHRSWINEALFLTVGLVFLLSIIYCFVFRDPESAS